MICSDFWKEKKHRIEFMEDVRKSCKLDSAIEDIYSIEVQDVLKLKGQSLLDYYSRYMTLFNSLKILDVMKMHFGWLSKTFIQVPNRVFVTHM